MRVIKKKKKKEKERLKTLNDPYVTEDKSALEK